MEEIYCTKCGAELKADFPTKRHTEAMRGRHNIETLIRHSRQLGEEIMQTKSNELAYKELRYAIDQAIEYEARQIVGT